MSSSCALLGGFAIGARRMHYACRQRLPSPAIKSTRLLRAPFHFVHTVTWENGRGCPLVVHYFAVLQSVHGFVAMIDNTRVCKLVALYTANAYSADRETSASACTRCVAGSY